MRPGGGSAGQLSRRRRPARPSQDGSRLSGRETSQGKMNRDAPVIVEFFGVPRLRAGRAELAVAPGTAAEVLAAVEQSCPGLAGLLRSDGRLVPHYLLSLDGREFVTDTSQLLTPGTRVLLLSADAGG